MIEELNIELKDIVKRYGERTVLNKVSLDLTNESFVSIVGKSGAGKSTMMNILGLIEDFDEGTYRFNDIMIRSGKDYADLRSHSIGFIFQSYNLIPSLSCRENILLPQLYSRHGSDNFDEIVETLGITDLLDKRVVLLSGGEKQRVAIARCLVLNPALIIADEPTGNLDKTNTEVVMSLLRSENNKGRGVIVITHSDEVAGFSKTIYRLENGSLNEENTTRHINGKEEL